MDTQSSALPTQTTLEGLRGTVRARYGAVASSIAQGATSSSCCGPSAGAAAYAIVHRASGALRRKPIELDADGRGELTVPFGARRVKRVTLTLANASTRFDCWRQELVYSCQGRPRDDDRSFRYAARVVRH